MDKRLNIIIISIMLFSIFLLSFSTYLDIKHEQQSHKDALNKLHSSIKHEYKVKLKETITTTILFIDAHYQSIIKDVEEQTRNEIKKLRNTLRVLEKDDLTIFVNNYTHPFLNLTLKKLPSDIFKSFIINDKNIYLYIKKEKIEAILTPTIRNFLYLNVTKDNRYIWIKKILNFKGGDNYAIRLIHPNLKQTENSFLSTHTQDDLGNKLYLEELTGIKKDKEVYSEYLFKVIHSEKVSKKLSYAKLYQKLNWVIATGIPLDNLNAYINNKTKLFEEDYQNHFFKMIIFDFFAIFLFILLLFIMKSKITKYFIVNQELKQELTTKLEHTQITYKELFYKNKSVILIIDPIEGSILDANEAALHFYNYSYHDLLAKNINEINTLTHEQIKQELVLAEKEQRDHFLFQHKISTGEVIPVKVFSTPTEYKGGIALHSIIQNIKEEYQVKEDLYETVKELKKVQVILDEAQRISHIGSWEFDIKTQRLFWSKETYNIFETDILYSSHGTEKLLSKIHPDDKQYVLDKYTQSIKTKEKYTIEYRLLFEDERVKFLSENAEHIYDKEGKHIKTLGSVQDISEIKEKTDLLFQQSKMAAIGEMMANIAHQWRQPLSVISTISSGIVLKKETNTLNDEFLLSSMEQITNSTQYLSHTIDDFRNFFKPNKDKTECYTRIIVNKTLKMLEAQFKNKGIEIITNIEDIKLNTYENELLQTLINIINNARDQLVKENIERKLIFLDVLKKENQIYITVLDNANGIEENIMGRIFEPYFTTKDKSIGTGIGLYMSEEIIKKHLKGDLQVENTLFVYDNINYKGAKFSIILNEKENKNV